MDKSKLARSHDRYGAGERESKDAIINSLTFSRDRPRYFDQVGHQTTNASIGIKHFFTK